MRKWVLLIAVIVIMSALAGCLKGDEEADGEETPELVQKHGTIPKKEGWAESNWAESSNEPWLVDINLPLDINNVSNIIIIKVSVKVDDSDAEHSESDEGSDPDEVSVSFIGGGNLTSEEKKGYTPATLNLEAKATATDSVYEYLPQTLSIQLHADCYGGKMYKTGPIPRPFQVYKDQGVAYTLEGEYTYMVPEIA